MQGSSSSSAGAVYLLRSERIEELRRAARRAAGCISEIRRVILFGSLVSGIPTPRSDADLVVEVESSSRAEPRDRVPEVLRAFKPLPCPLDVFVFTREEVERLREDSPVLRLALKEGVDLL